MAQALSPATSADPRQWKSPVEQISYVGENLRGRSHSLASLKIGEAFGRISHGLAAAIGERGQGVAQQIPFRIRD
jgi:hypothetical protein